MVHREEGDGFWRLRQRLRLLGLLRFLRRKFEDKLLGKLPSAQSVKKVNVAPSIKVIGKGTVPVKGLNTRPPGQNQPSTQNLQKRTPHQQVRPPPHYSNTQ